jgi:hypothetical protein
MWGYGAAADFSPNPITTRCPELPIALLFSLQVRTPAVHTLHIMATMKPNQTTILPLDKLPVSVAVVTSGPTCFISGEQPFSATTIHECIAERPIWALIRLYMHFFAGIKIHDLAREDRRIGPIFKIIVCDDFDEEERDLSDTALVRVAPGEQFSTSYSFWVEPNDGRKGGHLKLMVPGNTYHVGLRKRPMRWMFEDEMEKGWMRSNVGLY